MIQDPEITGRKVFDWAKEDFFKSPQQNFSGNENTPQLPGKIGGMALMLGGSGMTLAGVERLSEVETAGGVATTVIITSLGIALARAGIDTPFWRNHIAKSTVQIGSKQLNEGP